MIFVFVKVFVIKWCILNVCKCNFHDVNDMLIGSDETCIHMKSEKVILHEHEELQEFVLLKLFCLLVFHTLTFTCKSMSYFH